MGLVRFQRPAHQDEVVVGVGGGALGDGVAALFG